MSALIGLLVLLLTVLGLTYGDGGARSFFGRAVLPPDPLAVIVGGLLAAAIFAAAVNNSPSRWAKSLLWLAVAIAAPFLLRLIGVVGRPALPGQVHLVLSWLVPLAALAVEARRSERSSSARVSCARSEA